MHETDDVVLGKKKKAENIYGVRTRYEHTCATYHEYEHITSSIYFLEGACHTRRMAHIPYGYSSMTLTSYVRVRVCAVCACCLHIRLYSFRSLLSVPFNVRTAQLQ